MPTSSISETCRLLRVLCRLFIRHEIHAVKTAYCSCLAQTQNLTLFNSDTRLSPNYQQAVYRKVKRKCFPYSLPSVGPGADPGVQADSPQVTISNQPGPDSRLPLLSTRPAVTFPAADHYCPLGRYQVILLGDRNT